MSHIIHRNLRAVPPTAVSASGIEIVDRDGRRYIDASGGAAVSCLGHAHPHVLAAMHAQIDRIAYAHTSFFTSDAAEALADVLAADAPRGLDQVYLVSGGSEAIEAALKLARGQIDILHRDGGETGESFRVSTHNLSDVIVKPARKIERIVRFCPIAEHYRHS